MNKIYIILIIIVFYSCGVHKNKISIIDSFVENIILNETSDLKERKLYFDSKQYLKLNDSIIKNERKRGLLEFNLFAIKETLKSKKNEYKIVTYKRFKENSKFDDYIIIYDNLENMYCLISDNEFITSIVVNDDDKIISFFNVKRSQLIKNARHIPPKNKTIPFMLD